MNGYKKQLINLLKTYFLLTSIVQEHYLSGYEKNHFFYEDMNL